MVDEKTKECKEAVDISETAKLSNSMKSKFIHPTNISTFYFMEAPKRERKKTVCKEGYRRDKNAFLKPSENCDEYFGFELSENGNVTLVHDSEKYNESEFCLHFGKKAMIAEVCRKIHVEHRFT